MYAKAALSAAALTGFSLIQQSPAPVWTLIPGIASIVVNGISAHMDRRDLGNDGFELSARIADVPLEARQGQSCFGPVREGVPQHIVDSCCGGLAGAYVTVSGSPSTGVRISGLPYDCIPLAPWVDGTGTVPYACGDDCIEYSGLSGDEYQGLKNAFESRA